MVLCDCGQMARWRTTCSWAVFVPWRLFRELFVANGLKIVMTDGQLIGSFAAGGSLAGQSLARQLPATSAAEPGRSMNQSWMSTCRPCVLPRRKIGDRDLAIRRHRDERLLPKAVGWGATTASERVDPGQAGGKAGAEVVPGS